MKRFMLILTILLGLLYLFTSLNRSPDSDEMQSLLNSAAMARGERLYAGYWDNHGPLATWILYPIVAAFSSIFWSAIVSRLFILLFVAINAFLTYKISLITGESRRTAWFASLLFLLSPLVLFKGIDIRPDNFALTAFLAAVYFLISGTQSRRLLHFLLAGICLGIMASLTLKAVLHGLVFVLIALVGGLHTRKLPTVRQWIAIVLSGACTTLLWIGITALTTRFEAFWMCYIEGNASREQYHTPGRFLHYYQKLLPWMGFATVATWFLVAKAFKRQFTWTLGFALGACLLVFQYTFLLPTKYYQTLLSTVPLFALASAPLLDSILTRLAAAAPSRRRTLSIVLAILIAVAHLRSMLSFANLKYRDFLPFCRKADHWMETTSSVPAIFDMTGWLYQKPHVGQYQAMVRYLITAHRKGSIDLQIPQLLTENQVEFLIWDTRAQMLPVQDRAFIRKHYAPIDNAGELVLMKRLSGPPIDGELNEWWEKQPPVKAKVETDPTVWQSWFIKLRHIYEEEMSANPPAWKTEPRP